MYMLIILIFYYNFDRISKTFPIIKNFNETLITSYFHSVAKNWFFLLCFFILLIIISFLLIKFTIWLSKERNMYFTKLLAFFEFVLYIILLISICNFYMAPEALGYSTDLIGRRSTLIYIYTPEEMGFRLFLICAIPVLLLLTFTYIYISLSTFYHRKKRIDPNVSPLKTKISTIKRED